MIHEEISPPTSINSKQLRQDHHAPKSSRHDAGSRDGRNGTIPSPHHPPFRLTRLFARCAHQKKSLRPPPVCELDTTTLLLQCESHLCSLELTFSSALRLTILVH
jgi:hypothetical protein